MSNEEQMTINERYKYLRMMQKRYRKASRKERSRLLDEIQVVTQLHRKSLLRLMKDEMVRKPKTRRKSPGWPKGNTSTPKQRFEVVEK